MKSHEVLRETVENVGVKQVAFDLRVSSSLVYKWCAAPGGEDRIDASGARNPLDRVLQICASSRSRRPAEWLCAQLGGFFVENPHDESEDFDTEYLQHTQDLVRRFSKLLDVISTSIASEGRVDAGEAADIRRQWRDLQSHGEAFVRSCEAGHFDPER